MTTHRTVGPTTASSPGSEASVETRPSRRPSGALRASSCTRRSDDRANSTRIGRCAVLNRFMVWSKVRSSVPRRLMEVITS